MSLSRRSKNPRRRGIRICVIAAGLLASGVALADAQLDPQLLGKMFSVLPTDELQIIVSYEQSGPVSAGQIAALKSLGIDKGITMRALPIAGVLATPAEIRALAQRSDVVSLYFNAPVQFFNQEARELTGAARAVDNPADYGRAIPFSGRGVTVMVNDSGIDATHDDLKFGNHVVENVQAAFNLNQWENNEGEIISPPTPYGILPNTYLEGQLNTDLGSGHGTHVAGIVGGTGARSNGKYRGVAPGADLIGYGSGAVVLILDSIGGFDYALVNQFTYDHPIRVISNSWGIAGKYDPKNPVSIASYEAYKRGIVSVFAAGNSGPGEDTHNPYAQSPWVIAVAASEKDGVLTSFSSRGKRFESGTFTMTDGKSWTYFNQPTITAPGVNIVSTRTLTGALPLLAYDLDLDPSAVPFYTNMSGTSMAAPHVAGIVALMLEANPSLTPAQVKAILEDTATNMAGRHSWEVGAGHVNAYTAVAMAAGLRGDFGSTVNAQRMFNSYANLSDGGTAQFSVDYGALGTSSTSQDFTVGSDANWVMASAAVGDNLIRIALVDPDGVTYQSSAAQPLLGEKISVGAPAKPGVWKVMPASYNSASAPGTIKGDFSVFNGHGHTGLNDIAGHAARGAIEFAVGNRLLDGDADGKFRPDQWLKRGELAQYLVMGANVRQYLPFDGNPTLADVAATSPTYGPAEAVINTGASLRDLSQQQMGVMGTLNGAFRPNDTVTRASLAYSLVQALALQPQAQAFSGTLSVLHDGKRIPIEDAASIAPSLRGYVQLALDLELVNARFTVTQGPFDLQPTLHAWFDPGVGVTRAAYAVAASRYLGVWRSAED